MADGKPFVGDAFTFTQEEEPAIEPVATEATEAPLPEEERADTKLRNALWKANQWGEEPHYADQATRFPDTVRTHSVEYKLFNVTEPSDMRRYSEICISNFKKGRYVFDGPEQIQWDLQNARCFILVKVEERRFMTLRTSQSNPHDD